MFSWNSLIVTPVLLCGCAHGFDRDALRERLTDDTLQPTDATAADARKPNAQLQFPCRIAVYFKPSHDRDWQWSPEDKAALDQCAAALKKEGIASDVSPLPELLAGGKGEAKDLRLAAAQCGADVVFVIHGAAQTDGYKSVATVFDLTVPGGYVIPGSRRDSLFVVEGVLLDVGSGYVYTGVQAEGVGKVVRPTFLIEDRDAVARAKARAVAKFGDEVLTRMRALAAAPPVARPVGGSDVPQIKRTPVLTPDAAAPARQSGGGGATNNATTPKPAP